MNNLKSLNLIFKIEEDLENYKLKIQELKQDFNSVTINLTQYTSKVEDLENHIKELSNKFTSLQKQLLEQEKILKKEIDLLIHNFQVELDPENVTHIKLDFYSSTGNYFLIELNCRDYPNHIEISFPPDLTDLIGPPDSLNLIKTFPQKPPAHLIDIFRQIEEEIQGKAKLDELIQSIYEQFDVEQPTELTSKLIIHIYSLDAEQFDLELDLTDFPQLPKITLSPKLEKFIFLDSLNSIRSWSTSKSHVEDIIREISTILDRKLRLNMELKLLKQKGIDAVFDSVNSVIHVSLSESETNPVKYKFDIKIHDDYPSSPPIITQLASTGDKKLTQKFQNAVNNFIVEWFPAANLAEFFQELKENISESSEFVCSVCKKLACPYCSKNVTGTIPGVSGEYECSVTCPHCKRLFHKCCWKEYVKYSQKCPICQKHISIW